MNDILKILFDTFSGNILNGYIIFFREKPSDYNFAL